jgi:hypothetical protein
LQEFAALNDLFLLHCLFQGWDVNPDRGIADANEAVVEHTPVWNGFNREDTGTCLDKVARVFFGLETYECGPEDAFKEFRTDYVSKIRLRRTWETTEYFGRRECAVKEESNHGMRNHISDHLWNEEEMIIVYPDCITSFILSDDDFCECTIDFDVMLPTFLLPDFKLGIIRNLIMKCRPNDLFAISFVMSFQLGIGDEDGN